MTKILIVEDNELNMKLFYDILSFHKYEVLKAIDGLEAYKIIKRETLDLIILDIQLPKLTGFELLEKLKEEDIKLPPVIIASACAMDSDKHKAQQFGIEDYITKPIDINNFIKTVKQKLSI